MFTPRRDAIAVCCAARKINPRMLYGAWFGDHNHDRIEPCSKPLTAKSCSRAEEGQQDGTLILLERTLQCECGARVGARCSPAGQLIPNPSLSTAKQPRHRSSRERGERPEAGQRSPSGCALGRWTLTRVFNPLSENQPHETPYFPLTVTRGNAKEREILRSLAVFAQKRSPRSGNEHHL